jgi:hypothetical protein
MTSSRHGDGSCDVALSALVRRLSLTIPGSEETPLPVVACSAAGVPGEFVRHWATERAACCRCTTRPFAAPQRSRVAGADDTEIALGSDILTAALEGYALAKVFGKGAGVDALKEAMAARYSRKRQPSPVATACAPRQAARSARKARSFRRKAPSCDGEPPMRRRKCYVRRSPVTDDVAYPMNGESEGRGAA